MEYELVKQLKEAGFPLKLSKNWDGEYLQFRYNHGDMYLYPTLSELIEACGNEFPSLSRYQNVWICNDAEYDFGSDGEITRGNTPEEAVAKLWLELQNG